MGATRDWSSLALSGAPSVGAPLLGAGAAPESWNPYRICDEVKANTKLSRTTNDFLMIFSFIRNAPCRCVYALPAFLKFVCLLRLFLSTRPVPLNYWAWEAAPWEAPASDT